MESCQVVWFWVDKRPVCVSFSIKISLDTQTRFWVDGEWIDLEFTFNSKMFLFLVGAQ